MRAILMWVVSLALIAGPIAHAEDAKLKITIGGKTRTVTLTQLKKELKPTTVTIDDPVYHQKKTYEGFPLQDVLKLAGTVPATADQMVFTALDGYSPTVAMKTVREHSAVLTYTEQGKKGFQKVAQGKSMVDPGPFYVVWTDKVASDVPWPYQLAAIEVVSLREKFPKIFPNGAAEDSKAMKGFRTFQSQCIRCHSINLEGGEIGPELNIPKNVTEYWAADVLHEFIHDAPSFRYKSKMPSFKKELTAEQVDEIVVYLNAMRAQKIAPK